MSVYNAQKTVVESIQSVLDQDFSDFEYLIADDGSTDNSRALIDSISDERIKTFHNINNMGLLWTWNNLIDQAKGKYIIFQDADDLSLSFRFSKLIQFMINNPSVAVCGANFQRTFKKFRKRTVSNYPLEHNEILDRVRIGQIPFIRGIFRTSVVLEVGKFRSFFSRVGWEDYDLFLRIAEKYKVANIPDVLYEYAYYNTSTSKLDLTNWNVKKVFIHEIGLTLHRQRLANNGIDGVTDSELMKEVELFLREKEQFLRENPSYVYRKKIKNQLSNLDYWNALNLILKSIWIEPLVLANYSYLYIGLSRMLKNYAITLLKR